MKLWKSGNRRYVLGSKRIEAITADREDETEHLARMGQMLDAKKIATGCKSLGATTEQCNQFGLPKQREIKASSQRLLLGDSDIE